MRYDKVLLVSARFYKGKFVLSLLPQIGIGYIAEALLSANISVGMIDMNLQYTFNDLVKKIREFHPALIGFSMMTFGNKDVCDEINNIKKLFPHIAIAVGGPHVSTVRKKVLQDCAGIDFGFILEGDVSIVELCQGKKEADIQGIIYRQNNDIIENPYINFISNLDDVRFPRYEVFELDKYPTKQMGIISSRGCPYDCIYCPVITTIGKKFRQRSAQSVVEEVKYWYDRGYREIPFLDDNFTLVHSRVNEICDLLMQMKLEGLRLICPNGIRADKVDYELLKKMKEVGFFRIAFGVESANNKVLKNINKGESIEVIERSIKIACDLGYEVELFFIIGSPGETMEDMQRSFDLALRYPVANVMFYNIVPFVATELYQWIEKNGYFLFPAEDILNNASHFINQPCFFTPEMSEQDRKKAFGQGQRVSRIVRRRFIERKLSLPGFIKSIVSYVYTIPFIEHILISNSAIVKAKEIVKKAVLRRK
jgi:anaerobic magnesium-protoporphyrin IX monomethyl ester cyclase